MTLPSDNERGNDDANVDGTHPEYEMLGRFEPRDGKRILKRLEEQHLSFEVQECSQIGMYWPRSLLCIYVRPKDKKKAEEITDQDSTRSRVTAGIRYMAVGSIICAVVLLQMRSGVRTIPYHQRFGGYIELPLEMVAGIAGIVVFMGFLQLVIAFLFKLRGRQ
jgi:hypothetical protein